MCGASLCGHGGRLTNSSPNGHAIAVFQRLQRARSRLSVWLQMSRTEARSRPSNECIPPNSLHRLRHQQHDVAFNAGPIQSAQPPFTLANLISLRLRFRSSPRHSNAGSFASNITLLLRSSLGLSRLSSALGRRATPTSIQPSTNTAPGTTPTLFCTPGALSVRRTKAVFAEVCG